MNYVDLLLRWMHIFAAVALVGGTFFLRFVWYPSISSLSSEERESRFAGLRGGWAKIVMASTLFLLISGLVNAVNNITRHEIDSSYGKLVAVKFLVAMAMFFFSARVAGRSDSAVKFRESIGKWLTINSLLAVLLVGMAGYMKLVPRVSKVADDESAEVINDPGVAEPATAAP